MSRKVVITTEIRDMLILKDTLKQLGHNFTEKSQDVIEMSRSYQNITFDTKTGAVSYDDANTHEVEKIQEQYMVNFYQDKAIREGNQFKQEVAPNGDVIIRIIS